MKNSRRILIHSTAILIVILWPWEGFVTSNDISFSVEKQTSRINDAKTQVDSQAERKIKNLEAERSRLSNTEQQRGSSQEKTQPSGQKLNIKPVKQRAILSSEKMNSSLDTECVETEKNTINIKKMQSGADQMNTKGHIKNRDSYKRLKRHKRNPPTTPEGPPEGSPKGSPEGSSTEPLTTTEPTADPEQSWPEPEPDWPEALAKWQDAWPLHTYGFAAMFTVIALIPLFEMLRMYVDKIKISALKLTLLIIISLFSSTRAIALFVDPYGSSKRFHLVVTQLLFSLGHPCIISALSLLLLVLIDTTKMNIAPPRFQRVKFIIPVVISHVALVIVTDFVVVYFLEAKVLLLVCQIYFLLLGSLMALGYISVGWKIRTNIKANVHSKSSVDNSMRRLQYLITACAVTCIFICVLTVYGAAGVFGVYSDVQYVEAWPWWTLQTLNRLLEAVMCIVVLLMNTRTTKRKVLPSFITGSVLHSRRSTLNVKSNIPSLMKSCEPITSVG